MPYQSRHAGQLADLLMRQGEIEGSRAQTRGSTLASLIQGLASIPAGIQQDRAAQAELAERQQDREMARANVGSQIDARAAQMAAEIRKNQSEEEAKQTATWTRNTVGILGEYVSLPPEQQQAAWPQVQQRLASEGGWEPEMIPKQPMPTPWVKGQLAKFLPVDKAYGLLFPEPEKPQIAPPGSGIIENGKMTSQVPFKPDAPPAVGSFEDYLTRAHGENPTPAQIEAARKKYQQADDRPLAPIVIQTPSGPGVVDRGSRTVTPITDAGGQAVGIAPTEGERNEKRQYAKAKPILTAISSLSESINTLQGVEAKATGAVEKQKARINLNDDVAEYEALISGFTPLIARALGHVGVLTEQDVQSVKAMFPRPGDSKSLRDRKIMRIEQLMGQIESAGGVTPAPAQNGGEFDFDPATGQLKPRGAK